MIKYLVCPGHVKSKDGDTHYISARQLMQLYGVSPKECVIWQERRTYKGLIRLVPKKDGNYTIRSES